ncbi:MAG: ABC transporter permease [Bacteriovoracaceae bacterium]|nr:peptide ABC transporter permease [Halobacteriovoraceae bacterium]MDP7319569.1 ABC transporter permease [Bacteriovoracaceae bacterium]
MSNNWNYIIRRILYLIPVLLGVCFLVFILFNVTAGDPVLMLLGKHGSPEQAAALREQLGLNQSWFMQYVDVVKSAFTFDFGRSWSTKQEISSMIAHGAIPSLTLSLPAFFLSTVTSILFALLVAFYRGKGIDLFIRVTCIAMMSISSLVYILVFQYLLAYKWGLFEISGYEFGFPNFIYYVLLPIIIWVILSLGPDIRFYRTLILDEIYQDYVRTARAKGLTEKKILFKHVLRNAMIPIVTYTVVQLPFLLLGALLLESFFSIPGLGGMTINALNSSDFPVLKAITILSAIAYIVFTLIQDIIYTIVDPRVKLQ